MLLRGIRETVVKTNKNSDKKLLIQWERGHIRYTYTYRIKDEILLKVVQNKYDRNYPSFVIRDGRGL